LTTAANPTGGTGTGGRRRTAIMAGEFPMMAGKTPLVGEAVTVPTTIGARSHIAIGADEVSPVAGVTRSQSQTDLTPGYHGRGLFFELGSRAPENIPETIQRVALAVSGMLRVGLRISVICFTRAALP
jgi:hypothetical protein